MNAWDTHDNWDNDEKQNFVNWYNTGQNTFADFQNHDSVKTIKLPGSSPYSASQSYSYMDHQVTNDANSLKSTGKYDSMFSNITSDANNMNNDQEGIDAQSATKNSLSGSASTLLTGSSGDEEDVEKSLSRQTLMGQ